jgi:hypothetical protein
LEKRAKCASDPSKNGPSKNGPSAQKELDELTSAFVVLSDTTQRAAYDLNEKTKTKTETKTKTNTSNVSSVNEKELEQIRESINSNEKHHALTIATLRQTNTMKFEQLFEKVSNLEFKNEVLENASAVGKFQNDKMKMWKQDLMEEIENLRMSIPDATLEYNDEEIQDKLAELATTTTQALIDVQQSLNGEKDEQNLKMKDALDEQASAIAHLVASKADRAMVTEQFDANHKSGASLESSIRAFMKQVAHDIDDRDYRSAKISSCERAGIETRM